MRHLPLVALLLATPASAEPITLRDGQGTEITLPGPAARVACLITECPEFLAILGVPPVAFGHEVNRMTAMEPSFFGEVVAEVPVLSKGDGFDLEKLAALDPDLIVGWPGELPAEFDIAPLFGIRDAMRATTVAEMGQDLIEIGRALGRVGEATAFVSRVEDRFQA
jgi:iron complex transport system substrate-binding protein